MFTYLNTRSDDDATPQKAIESRFPDSHLKASEGPFLVPSNLLTEQIKNDLGVENGALGQVLMVMAASYGGWHSKPIWRGVESTTSCGASDAS